MFVTEKVTLARIYIRVQSNIQPRTKHIPTQLTVRDGCSTTSWPVFSPDRHTLRQTGTHSAARCSSPGFLRFSGRTEELISSSFVFKPLFVLCPVAAGNYFTHVCRSGNRLVQRWGVCEPVSRSPRLPRWRCWSFDVSVRRADVKPRSSADRWGLLLRMDPFTLGCALRTGEDKVLLMFLLKLATHRYKALR